MATITGTTGPDMLVGTSGSDFMEGGAGADTLDGGRGGDDLLLGGDGADLLLYTRPNQETSRSTLDGGAGDDTLVFGGAAAVSSTAGPRQLLMRGGDGSDAFMLNPSSTGWTGATVVFTIEGGAGDDYVTSTGTWSPFLSGAGLTAALALGPGRDVVELGMYRLGSNLTFSDFETGAAGDRLHLNDGLRSLAAWNPDTNPFAGGFLRLVQEGADVLLQVDGDGAAGAAAPGVVARFQNRTVGQFTADNLSGYAPDGSTAAGRLVVGGPGLDRLFGSGGSDILQGAGGDDLLRGGGGNDRLSGGDGADDLNGEQGADTLDGGSGDDLLVEAAGGDDVLLGGEGADRIVLERLKDHGKPSAGPPSRTTLDGGGGDDVISFSAYDFSTTVTPHDVLVLGGAGADVISLGAGGSRTVDAGPGDDRVTVAGGRSTSLTLGEGRDSVVIRDAPLVSIRDFAAGAGGDWIDIGASLNGTAGWNGGDPFAQGYARLTPDGASTRVEFNYRTLNQPGWFLGAVLENVPHAALTAQNFGGWTPIVHHVGGAGADTLQGGEAAEALFGDGAADVIRAAGGNDTLDGGAGLDSLDGGTGDDRVISSDADVIEGGPGDDHLLLDRRSLPSFSGAITGGAAMSDGTRVSGVERLTFWGSAGADLVGGGVGADSMLGLGGDDRLSGEAGGDTLTGGEGGDTLLGGAGEDLLQGDAGADRLEGGDDADRLLGGLGADVLLGGAGADTLDGGADADSLDGGDGNDILLGGAGGDTLDGGAGLDRLVGGDGDDLLISRGADEVAAGEAGIDHLVLDRRDATVALRLDLADTVSIYQSLGDGTRVVGIERLTFFGGAGADYILGGGLSDTLNGGDGDDTLGGAGGLDVLDGGEGRDTAVFEGASSAYSVLLGSDGSATVTLINSGVAETVRNFERLLFRGDGVLRELVTVPAIVGTEGNDGWLQGGSGADLLRGLGGDDMLVGRGGADTLDGGSGYDHAAFGGSFPGSRFERQADGSVLATTSDGVDRLINIEAVWFSGDGAWRSIKELVGDHGTTGSDNWVEGTAGADKLYGLAGDDLLVGRGGDDVLNGGPGWDTAYYAGLSYNVTFERQEDGSVLVYGYEGVDRLIDMEAVWFHTHQEWRSVKELVGDFGTAGADPWIQGTRFNDRLFGLGGDDILVGSPGNDLIDGGAGYDSVIYHASRSDFRIERRADGAVLVTDIRGDGGADVLIGVEGMWFAHDGTWFETAWLL